MPKKPYDPMKPGPPYEESPVHYHFGLSYAHWLVLPRVVMEHMPHDWQRRMVTLLKEMDDRFDWMPKNRSLFVQARLGGVIVKLPRELCNYRHPDRSWLKSIFRGKHK